MTLYDELHPEVKKILGYIENLTGKGFEYIQNPKMFEYAGVKMARSSMPNHIILYHPDYNKLVNHLIAHECGHIKRMFETDPLKRRVPGITGAQKEQNLIPLKDQIHQLTRAIGDDKTLQITNQLYDGLVRQVTNQPIDLLIEKWIYEEYPDLRQIQLESLDHQNKLALSGLTHSAKKLIPPFFFRTSTVMSIAFTDLLSKVIKIKLIREWKKSELFIESKRLSDILDINSGWAPERDYGKIDAWSELLNIEHFYRWILFEDIPDDYLTQNTGV